MSASGSGILTEYTYDALNNLRSVTQHGAGGESSRSRSFVYDAQSRLLVSTNPETGTTCYGLWSGGSCINGYDGNGNLLYKTDNRGVIAGYTYDALNRMVALKVSGGSAATQSSCYFYGTSGSGVSYGVNRLIGEWTQTADCPSAPTSIPSGALTSRSITAYYATGNPSSEVRCVLNHCNTSTPQNYSYDYVGNLTSYNDGRGVSSFPQSFDLAGRLQTIQRTSGGVQTPVLNIRGYDPAGWNDAVLGTSLIEKRTFDNRMRVQSEIVRKP